VRLRVRLRLRVRVRLRDSWGDGFGWVLL
jgi:hypothetical protein